MPNAQNTADSLATSLMGSGQEGTTMLSLLRRSCISSVLALVLVGSASAQWTAQNPGAGGAFTSIGAGPTGIILCGSDLGGAYRSLDDGVTWDCIGSNRGLAYAHVRSVAFDPSNSTRMFLGSDHGIYRSTNSGATFSLAASTSPIPIYITAIIAAPSNPATMYAASDAGFSSPTAAIYKSTDYGANWTQVKNSIATNTRVLKLVVHPTNSSRVFAVTGGDGTGINPETTPPGWAQFNDLNPWLYESTDGGVTWIIIGPNIGGDAQPDSVQDFAIDPQTPSRMWLTTKRSVNQSLNRAGDTWRREGDSNPWMNVLDRTGCIAIKRDVPTTVRIINVFVGSKSLTHATRGVWETTTGGDATPTWIRKSGPEHWGTGWQALTRSYARSGHGICPTIGTSMKPLAENDLLWVTSQFAYRSTNGGGMGSGAFGNVFTNAVSGGYLTRKLENVTVAALHASEAQSQLLFNGYHDIGLWRSVNAGASWVKINEPAFTGTWAGEGGNTTTVLGDPARANLVWASMGEKSDKAVLVRSTSTGDVGSWSAVTGLGATSGFIRGLSLDRISSQTNRTLFVTHNGSVYKSVNDGQSWTSVHTGVLVGKAVRVTAVDRYNSTVYAGGEGGMYVSPDGGSTWIPLGPAAFTGSLTGEPEDERWTGIHDIVAGFTVGTVYAVAYGGTTGSGRGLYRSTDHGVTWTQLRTADFARAVAQNPANPSALMLACSKAFKGGGSVSTSEGLLYSLDGGANWSPANEGLAFPFVARVTIQPFFTDNVMIGAPGNGFLTRILSTGGGGGCEQPCEIEGLGGGGDEESAADIALGAGNDFPLELGRVRPSPSWGLSTVSWSIPREEEGASYELALYDIGGRRVSSLAQGIAKAGKFTRDVSFTSDQGLGLRNGIFFVRLRIGSQVIRRTVILAR